MNCGFRIRILVNKLSDQSGFGFGWPSLVLTTLLLEKDLRIKVCLGGVVYHFKRYQSPLTNTPPTINIVHLT